MIVETYGRRHVPSRDSVAASAYLDTAAIAVSSVTLNSGRSNVGARSGECSRPVTLLSTLLVGPSATGRPPHPLHRNGLQEAQ
jgi:hypothetical protein